jgi:hypothetical protein
MYNGTGFVIDLKSIYVQDDALWKNKKKESVKPLGIISLNQPSAVQKKFDFIWLAGLVSSNEVSQTFVFVSLY